MTNIDQRLEQLSVRARNAVASPPAEVPFGFAIRAIASARAATDTSALWTRFSLAALPVASVATAASLWLSARAMSADAHDLAQVFIQTPLFP
ncbi:hypothetical protein [Prosthecobacter sp.]|jgi:hypothetical protein|uniref:hypothetical protein n=1 Tax=Prosthecobacter sp. TaxID=1965333 RepID=UPI0037C9E469